MIILKDILKYLRSALFNLDILFMKIEIDRRGKISLGGGKICLGGGRQLSTPRGGSDATAHGTDLIRLSADNLVFIKLLAIIFLYSREFYHTECTKTILQFYDFKV